MHQINTIIFDLDGVIINSEILWDRSAQEFLGRRGLAYDRERTKPQCTGKSLLEGTRIIQAAYGLSGQAEDLAQERKSIVADLYQTQLEFMPGFRVFFKFLQHAGYKTAIATSCHPELLRLADQRVGLTPLFQSHIYSIADVNHISKPNPDLFLFVAKKLGVSPDACAVIEDSPNGVLAAKRAKMFCIALTGTYPAEILAEGDLIVPGFTEIREFLISRAGVSD